MDNILEKLDDLSALPTDELAKLSDEIKSESKTLIDSLDSGEYTADTVAEVEKLAEAIKAVNAEIGGREAEQKELANRLDAAKAALSSDNSSQEESEDPKEEDAEGATEEEKKKAEKKESESGEFADNGDKSQAQEVLDESQAKQDAQAEAEKIQEKAENASEDVANESNEEAPEVAPEDPERKPEEQEEAIEEREPEEETEFATKPVGKAQTTEATTPKEVVKTAAEGDPVSVADKAKQERGDIETTPETTSEVDNLKTKNPNAPADGEEIIEDKAEDVVATKKPTDKELDTSKTVKKSSEASAEDVAEKEKTNEESELANHDENSLEAHETASAKPQVTITASAEFPGASVGTELTDFATVAKALMHRVRVMGNTSGGDGEHQNVATFRLNDGVIDTLDMNDANANTKKLEAAVKGQDVPESLTASGGLYAPVETRYDIYTIGEKIRPVKDALPTFGADRGGVRYVQSPVLSDLAGAVSLWTLNDDIAAAVDNPQKTKPALRVKAGEEITVYVDAIPLSLIFGNFGARFAPEVVEAHIEYAMIQQARFAESRILARIEELSTKVTTTAKLGAARDVLTALDVAVAGYRSRNRLSGRVTLNAIFPEWFREALRADLVRQQPGDGIELWNLANNTIDNWFQARGIKPIWALDGSSPDQLFATQEAGALLDFPDTLKWYLFAEGTFVFLDGGELNLGVVRDSTLNATNDYQMFVETFEGVAKFGNEALAVTSDIKVLGSHTGPTAVAEAEFTTAAA